MRYRTHCGSFRSIAERKPIDTEWNLGRQWHIVKETLGEIVDVHVHSLANIQTTRLILLIELYSYTPEYVTRITKPYILRRVCLRYIYLEYIVVETSGKRINHI